MLEVKKYPRAPTWKKGKVLSLELRNGEFTLFQMLERKGYIAVFDGFKSIDEWKADDLSSMDELFKTIATTAFFRRSTIKVQKHVKPTSDLTCPEGPFIDPGSDFEEVTAWAGTENERTFLKSGNGDNCLISWTREEGCIKEHCEPIHLEDYEKYQEYELNGLSVYPNINERIYLCSIFGRNVNPEKDLAFQRDLPIEYLKYIDIISGKILLSDLGY